MKHNLVDGHYTSVFPDGNYVTFKIEVAESGSIVGQRIISVFNSWNNQECYTAFAFVNGNYINFWNSFKNKSKQFKNKPEDFFNRINKGVAVLESDRLAAGKEYGLRSGRCCVCNKELTNPNSIKEGIGPICSRKFVR